MSASGPDTVLIVGGGPAGLATAIAARLAGLPATVIEASTPPLDKACGEGLMPDAVESLRRLGVRIPEDERHVFRGIRYLAAEGVAEACFPSGQGFGVRRTALHRALVRRAEEVGVDLRWGLRVEGLDGCRIDTPGGPLEGDWLVAADGLRSRLRRWAALDGSPARHRRFGVRRHFALAPWTDLVEVYWADGFEAYVTPVAANQVGVAFLWEGRKASFGELLQGVPDLARRLSGATASSRDRGCGPLEQRVRAVAKGRLALVGDASGYLDAITGEGLALAFHQAFALVEAIRAGDLRAYARAHRRIARLPDALTRTLLYAERHPELRRRLIALLARDPQLFRQFLGVHARTLRLRELGWSGLLRLARGLLPA